MSHYFTASWPHLDMQVSWQVGQDSAEGLFPLYFRMFLDCGAYASSTEVNDSVRKSVLNILTILFVSSPLHSSLSSPDGAVCQCALAPPTRR